MSKPYKVVADVFALVAKCSIKEENYHIEYNYKCINLTTTSAYERNRYNHGYNYSYRSDPPKVDYVLPKVNSDLQQNALPVKYFEAQFSDFSLTDLRDVLYILMPLSTTKNDNNTLEHVKFAIKYIENEIKSQNASQSVIDAKKSDDLIESLQSKCESLEYKCVTLENKCKSLENKKKSLQNKYVSLENINKDLQDKNKGLQTVCDSLNHQNKKLQNNYDQLKSNYVALLSEYEVQSVSM